MRTKVGSSEAANLQAQSGGEFFRSLSHDAISDFESLELRYSCPAHAVLFLEKQTPSTALVLIEGQVTLSLHLGDGRRLILRIARPGEILGLMSVFSGSQYEITEETLRPCRLASLRREDFLEFLMRHPAAYRNVAFELSLDYNRACERLRTVGLRSSAPAKLAQLLLQSCADGSQPEPGSRFDFHLTHQEISECIGVSRETVSRNLNDFQRQQLINLSGSILTIPNRLALERYATKRRRRSSIRLLTQPTAAERAAAWIGSSGLNEFPVMKQIE